LGIRVKIGTNNQQQKQTISNDLMANCILRKKLIFYKVGWSDHKNTSEIVKGTLHSVKMYFRTIELKIRLIGHAKIDPQCVL
jgi:hypothetical protein